MENLKNSKKIFWIIAPIIVVLVIFLVFIIILQVNRHQTTNVTDKEKKVSVNFGSFNSIEINWLAEPKILNTADIITLADDKYYNKIRNFFIGTVKAPGHYPGFFEDFLYEEIIPSIKSLNISKIGTVKKSDSYPYLKDRDLLLITSKVDREIKGDVVVGLAVNTDEGLVLLHKYYPHFPKVTHSVLYSLNRTIDIANFIEPPQDIKIPNSDYYLVKYNRYNLENPYVVSPGIFELEKIFEYKPGQYVYKDKKYNSSFLVKAIDGTVRMYGLARKIIKDDNKEDYEFIDDYFAKENPKSFYNNDYITIKYATCDSTGFGFLPHYNSSKEIKQYYYHFSIGSNYPKYIININQLKEIGKTKYGEPIYELKNKNTKIDSAAQNTIYEEYFNSSSTINSITNNQIIQKMIDYSDQINNYEDFMKLHPIIYLQDPFGKFIEFKMEFSGIC